MKLYSEGLCQQSRDTYSCTEVQYRPRFLLIPLVHKLEEARLAKDMITSYSEEWKGPHMNQ